MTIYWTSEDCDRQAILTLHLSVTQVILFPYFDHWAVNMPLFWNSVQILSVARTRREHWSYKFCRTFPFLRSRSFQHVMSLNGMVSIQTTVHLHIIPFVFGSYLFALVVLYRTNIDVCTWSHSHLRFDIGPNIRFNLDNGNFFVNSCYGTTGKKCER